MKALMLIMIVFVLVSGCSGQERKPGKKVGKEIAEIEHGLTKAFVRSGEAIEKYSIEDRMADYNIPGLSIAVVIDGKLRWAKGYGVANTKTGSKVTNSTLFQAASISKPISALAVLKLVDENKIDLDTNVTRYLSSWKLEENGLTGDQAATLRLILSHQGGISVHGFEGYKQSEKLPSLDDILNGEGNSPKIEVFRKPGEHAIYSGGGYTVVQKLLQDQTGEPFDSFMEKNILKELHMVHSTFKQPLPKKYHHLASAAYDKEGNIIEGLWHNYPEQAAAGLWTTPSDLARYLIEIMEIRNGGENGFLSTELVNEMLSLQGGGYHGLGPELTDSDGNLEFGHLGKNAGFTNDMLAGVDTKNAIIIMTNADNGGFIMSEIQRSVCHYYGIDLEIPETQIVDTATVTEEYLHGLTGRYEFVVPETGERLGQYMNLGVSDGRLTIHDLSSGDTHTLDPLTNNRFLDFRSGLLIGFMPPGDAEGFVIEDWEAKLLKVE